MKDKLKVFSFLAVCSLCVLVISLYYFPEQTLLYFWNVIIPVVPIILFISAGFWRNICPLGFISQIPQLTNLTKQNRTLYQFTNISFYISLAILLFAIVARKFWFNSDAELLIVLILLLGVMAVSLGFIYEGKSGWCNGLCPLYSVEKFYGQNPLFNIKNCFIKEKENRCLKCSSNCVDISKNKKTSIDLDMKLLQKEHLFSAIFPGFILGYFLVDDYPTISIFQIFYEMGVFTLVSVVIYAIGLKYFSNSKLLTMSSSAITLNIYYLFTIYHSFSLFFPNAIYGWTLLISGILNVLLIIYSFNWVVTYYLESTQYKRVDNIS